jgi:NAD(P)-dependent dehydrogenase (short-subunit alcohol dehydrogenase family)
MVALTRSQVAAWSRHGVCANAVVPGSVRTARTGQVLAGGERVAALARRTMIGRNGAMDDFPGIVFFLAGNASSYATGQAMFVDGGFSSTRPSVHAPSSDGHARDGHAGCLVVPHRGPRCPVSGHVVGFRA